MIEPGAAIGAAVVSVAVALWLIIMQIKGDD